MGINIKLISRDVVLHYVHFIKDKVREDTRYQRLGIDSDIDIYLDFFKLVLGRALGVQYEGLLQYDSILVEEVTYYIEGVLKSKGYSSFLGNRYFIEGFYTACVAILLTVKEEEYGNKDYIVH